jgi:hypothetical protein
LIADLVAKHMMIGTELNSLRAGRVRRAELTARSDLTQRQRNKNLAIAFRFGFGPGETDRSGGIAPASTAVRAVRFSASPFIRVPSGKTKVGTSLPLSSGSGVINS